MMCVLRLGRRHSFLMSTSLSCLLGVAVCLSNSAVIFLLLRLLQGATLAGVFVSSYIMREFPPPTYGHVNVMLHTTRHNIRHILAGLRKKRHDRSCDVRAPCVSR